MPLSFKERHNKCIIELLLQYPKEELTAKEIFARSKSYFPASQGHIPFRKSEQVGRRMIDLQRVGHTIDGVTYYVDVVGFRDGMQTYKITFAPSEMPLDNRVTKINKHLKLVLRFTHTNNLKDALKHFKCAQALLFSMQPKVNDPNQSSIFDAVSQ